MPERGALDISGLVEQYSQWFKPVVEEKPPEFLDAGDDLYFEVPVVMGNGPARWSSSTVLAPSPMVCHDVNGYYRELGVDWRCTRKELRQAYQRLGGQASARLTYCFKQLLNPTVRAAYNRAPLGWPFLDDYTQDAIKVAAAREAARRTGATGQVTSAETVLDDWGLALEDDEPPLDTASEDRQNSGSSEASVHWAYASYAWKTRTFLRDERRMEAWQIALSVAAARRSVSPVLCIGTTDVSVSPFTLVDVGTQRAIMFSGDEEPSEEIAGQALDQFL